MYKISYSLGTVLIILGWAICRISIYLKNRSFNWKSEAKQIFFLINLLVIYRFTFHPFSKVDGQVQPLIFEISTAWPFRVNLIPVVNLLDYDSRRDLLINIIGNFAMFIPTGIMVPLIYRKLDTFKATALTGFILSLIIEIIQLPFAVRASDVDDLILNTAGCMTGYGILALIRFMKKKIRK